MEIMKTKDIIEQLSLYLSHAQIEYLKITSSYIDTDSSKLVFVMAVSRICEDFEATDEDEKIVSGLLVDLLKNVFV